MTRTRLLGGLTALAFLLTPAALLAASGPHLDGLIGKKAALSIDAKSKGGKVASIKSFSWDGLKCGHDRFTGGLSKSVKVKNDSFKSVQPVGGVDVDLELHLRGHFTKGGDQASGTLKIKGACETGKKRWKASVDGL